MSDRGSPVPTGGAQIGVPMDRYTPPVGTADYGSEEHPSAVSSESILKETLQGQGKKAVPPTDDQD